MMISLELAQTISVNQGSAIDLCLKDYCVGPGDIILLIFHSYVHILKSVNLDTFNTCSGFCIITPKQSCFKKKKKI